jgi:hypothetical protein
MKLRLAVLPFFAFGLLTLFSAAPQSNSVLINLIKEDEFAIRTMKIVNKSGERVNGALSISFDASTKEFLMKGVAGDTTRIAAADIDHIDFAQQVRKQNPAAQEAAWKITNTLGRQASYTIPEQSLKIEAGTLTLIATSEMHAAGLSQVSTSQCHSDAGPPGLGVEIPEPKLLAYDKQAKLFRVEVQYVQYCKTVSGSSGNPGVTSSGTRISKPLQ